MTIDPTVWEQLMAQVTEQADYVPGGLMVPGGGSEGDDPAGEELVDLGPLAFVVNEGLRSAIIRGVDKDALLNEIVLQCEGATMEDVEAVLDGSEICPDPELIQAFADSLSLDASILVDAARRGGCDRYGYSTSPAPPPGF